LVHSSARSTSPAGQPGDQWRDRRGRATYVVRLCGERRAGHIVGRACAAGYGCKAHIEVRGGPERRQSPLWGLARIHPVRTYLTLLGKKVRTGSIKTITWPVHIKFRISATVSGKLLTSPTRRPHRSINKNSVRSRRASMTRKNAMTSSSAIGRGRPCGTRI